MLSDLGWRYVVAAHDRDGRPIFEADADLHQLEENETWLKGRILALPAPPISAEDGAVDTASNPDGPGSLAVDALVIDSVDVSIESPTSGSVESFEAFIVVRGDVEVEVGSSGAVLQPGQVFVPRGHPYGLKAAASEETRLVRVRTVADPKVNVAVPTGVRSSSGPARRVRRIVAGIDSSGQLGIMQDGDPAVMFVLGDESNPDVALADVWELGGHVGSAEQGGDAPEPYALEPRASGMKILNLEMKPVPDNEPANEGGWHATATIDVDIVIAGTVEMYLPDLPPVTLGPGDILVQRGTSHLWRVIGDRSLRMVTIMVGIHD
jgi:quercetin dioxygenase-like cupin family protein